MNKSVLILFTLLVFVQLKCAFGVKPRFAPKYCLRFKFDCTSPEKKGHVCCLFPLPIEGNDLGEKSSSPYKVPSVKVGVQKIRPLRIPSRRNGDDSSIESASSTHAKNQQKRKEASKKKTAEKQSKPSTKKSQIKRPTTRPNRPRKPFICRRFSTANCKKNPGHTCCKFEAEEAKRKQEEEKQKQIEEISEEINNESVEGQGEVKQEKVETVISEVPVQSLETVSNPTPAPATRPTIHRKTIDNAPISAITQNDVEKQQLEASIASSKKEETQFKTIQLNSREPTRNIVTTRKNVVQPVATIEAVPLDLVVEIKTPNQGLRKQNNVDNVHSHSAKHQNNPDIGDASSPVRIFHNETNAPHLAHVPLVDLPVPDDEPYERIPAECFTMSFDCKTSPGHMCCAYHQR